MSARNEVINLLTIDVEEWFHTSALEPYISTHEWDKLEFRAVTNVHKLLDIFDNYHARGTFFILGWMAERFPELVKTIDFLGHEICSHGFRHRLIYNLTSNQFKDYVERSKKILEDLVGKPIQGYRATSFSIVQKTLWALDIIKEAGFRYDSSIFPIGVHDLYGIKGFPRFPYILENGLIEIPPSTLSIMGKNLPFGGGGYFRLYPYWLTKLCILNLNSKGYPAMVYLHPWELDATCPRVKHLDARTRFRQYINLAKTEDRIVRLLSEFRFGTISEYLDNVQHNLIPLQKG